MVTPVAVDEPPQPAVLADLARVSMVNHTSPGDITLALLAEI
jgi:hypothetical protein